MKPFLFDFYQSRLLVKNQLKQMYAYRKPPVGIGHIYSIDTINKTDNPVYFTYTSDNTSGNLPAWLELANTNVVYC